MYRITIIKNHKPETGNESNRVTHFGFTFAGTMRLFTADELSNVNHIEVMKGGLLRSLFGGWSHVCLFGGMSPAPDTPARMWVSTPAAWVSPEQKLAGGK